MSIIVFDALIAGREAVDFLIQNRYAPTREDAVILGRFVMKETKAFKHVSGDHSFEDRYLFYHFVKRGNMDDGFSDSIGIDSYWGDPAHSSSGDVNTPTGSKDLYNTERQKQQEVEPVAMVAATTSTIESRVSVRKSSESLHDSHSDDKHSMGSIGLETRSSDKTLAINESLTEIDVEASVSSRNSQARSKRGPSNVTTKELAALLKSNVEQKDRTYRLTTYRNCFIGEIVVFN
jgi:hypothetical protein